MARQNKSNELAEMLRAQIVGGRLKAGEQLEAIAKLAKRHETTVATVSKALEGLERAGYVERFSGKGVFVKEKQNYRLALVMDSDSYNPSSVSFLPIIFNELERKCREENWSYELFFSVNDRPTAQQFLLKLAQNAFDVVLVCSRWLAENSADIFRDKPVFPIGIYPYKELDHSISFDLYRMVYDAVVELDRMGCCQIALVDSNKDLSWSQIPDAAARGYADALKSIGQLRNPKLHLRVPISQQGGGAAFRELIRSNELSRPFGIISVDSMITLGIIQTVLTSGLRISEDVIIATHANRGCGAAQFTVPIIKYEYAINTHMDRIAEFIRQYGNGGEPYCGIDLLPPEKKVLVPQKTALFSVENFS